MIIMSSSASQSTDQSVSGFPAGQPLEVLFAETSHGANSRCRLTADQKLVLVRLCTQHGQKYLGSKDTFWFRRTSDSGFNGIMKKKIPGARSIVDTQMK